MTVYVRTFKNQEKALLEALAKGRSVPVQMAQRARLVLASAAGHSPPHIAQQVRLSAVCVREWVERFNAHGVLGLFDRARSGHPPEYTAEQALRVVEVATSDPSEWGVPANTWTLRQLQRYLETHTDIGRLCRETIRGILHANGISWQEAQHWQESSDPDFEGKKQAVETCYIVPPANTIILCFDQKGPVQFKRRGGRHYRPRGKPKHIPETYTRFGTGYMLAALNPHTGQVWERCFQKYNSGTVIWFLGWLLAQLPAEMEIIIIWDNASPHSETVKRWLTGRFQGRVRWLHTPSKAAWLNLIEAWMSIFERDVTRNSAFTSLADFALAARRYVAYYNAQCHPFRWGRSRRKRVFLVGPLRRTVLWGRACRPALSDRFARMLAKLIIT
jgi:putative transposase